MNRSRLQGINDLLAVEAAVLDKNVASVPSADDHAGQVDSRHIAFERIRIKRGFSRIGVELHAQAFDKFIIGVIAGQGEYLSRGQSLLARAILHNDFLSRDLFY